MNARPIVEHLDVNPRCGVRLVRTMPGSRAGVDRHQHTVLAETQHDGCNLNELGLAQRDL